MGTVYILTNDSMPGIIKIGITETSVDERIKTLDNTSLPLPFRFYFAIESNRYKEIEKLAHNTFSDYRIRENREFFRIDPERAVSALKISGENEIKSKNDMIDETGSVWPENSEIVKLRRKPFSFDILDIKIGSELIFTRDDRKKCTVISNREVEYNKEFYSLSKLAREFLKEIGYDWSSVQGPNYFEYNGKTLSELRKEKENNEVEDETEENI